MMHLCVRLALLPFALAFAACAGASSPAAAPGPAPDGQQEALAMQRDWWRAFATADTAYLQAHTAPELTLTLSSGLTFSRTGALAQAAQYAGMGRLGMEWGEESVRLAAPSALVLTARVTETEGQTVTSYRYLTVLQRSGDGWRVAAAQSTRELVFTPRVPVAAAGALADYAGGYRTPRGGTLQVVVRDSALGLVEPSGKELPLEPVGPGLFEFRELSPANGIVRFVFTRDSAGRVAALVRLIPGHVNTFPRIP